MSAIYPQKEGGVPEKKSSFVWRYLGAMMTEKKNGGMAASFTRVLGVITFVVWMTLMVMQTLNPDAWVVPGELTWVLVSLIGIKGAKDVGKAIRGTPDQRAIGAGKDP
jgi:hypothetical protein